MIASRGEQTSRRLVMPELLESRNAPGALLPLPVFWNAFAGDLQDAGLPIIEDLSQQTEGQTYYRTDLVSMSLTNPISSENITNVFRPGEATDQLTQIKIDTARQTTEFRTPEQLQVVNSAFASFSLNDIALVPINPQLPPPVIHPAEPSEGESQEESHLPNDSPKEIAETPPVVTQPVITDPTSEHNLQNGATENLTPPPVIQPVITDPESEHNQPSPSVEMPPPVIQPVIMDPESEHNLQ
jgi:hypothetical protein